MEQDVIKRIADAASRRGAKVRVSGAGVEVYVDDEPVYVVVEEAGGGYSIVLKVAGDIGEKVDEILGENGDPREVLEEALDNMIALVDDLEKLLKSMGYSVRRSTREAILDLYDAIEARVEEA